MMLLSTETPGPSFNNPTCNAPDFHLRYMSFSSGVKRQLLSGSSDNPLRVGQESCSLILANTGAPDHSEDPSRNLFPDTAGAELERFPCNTEMCARTTESYGSGIQIAGNLQRDRNPVWKDMVGM